MRRGSGARAGASEAAASRRRKALPSQASPRSRAAPGLEQKVSFLRDRRSYPDAPAAVQAIETHFAWVFLTRRHAYKLKKPVRQSHMDYRTLAARERGCREEVRLNRRLAPAVYQGVVPLCLERGRLVLGRGGTLAPGRDGRLVFGRDGQVVDWLVRMRRLPASRMLDRVLTRGRSVGADLEPVLTRGRISSADLDRIVAALQRFYARAAPSPVAPAAYVARLKREVRANARVLRHYGAQLPQRLVTRVIDAQLALIDHAKPWLAPRGAQVVEGHGDLRAEHVALGPPVAIIDALEFDRCLRLLDPAEEIALLALEIGRLGHAALADELVRRFRAASGHAAAPIAFAFYKSHRAATRAKVAAWHLGDPQFPDPRPWVARTRSLLEDALRFAHEAQEEPAGSLRAAGGRPALQQRHERRARQHQRNGIAKERRDRKHAQALIA